MRNMAYKLIITQAAHNDLDEALDYIANRLANPSAAASLLTKIEECYAQLRDYPSLYELCHDLRLKNLGYRKVPIGNYVIIYRPAEEEHTVYILRVFYGGRDYQKLI